MIHEVAFLVPELIAAATALIVLVADLFVDEEHKHYLAFVSVAGLLTAIVFSIGLIGERVSVMGDMFVVDSFGIAFKIIVLSAASLAILLALGFRRTSGSRQGEYHFLVLASVVGMMIMVSSSNLMATFLGIQVTSVPLYILAGFRRNDERSNEASLKYFLLGILTAAVTLYGMSFLYGLTGTLNLFEMSAKLAGAKLSDPALFIGMTFVVAGMTFKIAAVPFHFWAPDVYEGAPTPVTAFIAAVPKVAGFAAIARLVFTAFPHQTSLWIGILAVISVLSMLTGNLMAIPQRNIKRMLAFSSIAHVGYALTGLVAASRNSVGAIMFYLIAYAAMTIGAFAIIIVVGPKGANKRIEDFAGLSSRSPWLAGAMLIFMLSMLGFPLTAGFSAKFLVFGAVVEKGLIWLALVGFLNSVISLYYYFGVVRQMYLLPAKTESAISVPISLVVVIGIAVLVTLALGLYPEPFIHFARSLFVFGVKI